MIQQELSTIVHVGLRFVEQTHRTPDLSACSGFGHTGLKDVLEAQFFFILCDIQEIRRKIFQFLEWLFCGVNDGTEILDVQKGSLVPFPDS